MSGDEFRIASSVFAVRLDDDTFVWNDAAEQLHRLNPAATLVWECLRDWATADAISGRLQRAGHLDGGEAERCVEALYALGIVDRRTRAAPQPSSMSSGS